MSVREVELAERIEVVVITFYINSLITLNSPIASFKYE